METLTQTKHRGAIAANDLLLDLLRRLLRAVEERNQLQAKGFLRTRNGSYEITIRKT